MVASVEAWGYRLVAPAAATGCFRALFAEVEPVGPELLAHSPTGEPDDAASRPVPLLREGAEGRDESLTDTPVDVAYVVPERRPPGPTPTGELCPDCGCLMVRTGTCLTCQSCGASSGGCG